MGEASAAASERPEADAILRRTLPHRRELRRRVLVADVRGAAELAEAFYPGLYLLRVK